MSDALALVRFPDGELRAAYYFGGADAVVPILFDLDEIAAVFEAGIDPLLDTLSADEPGTGEPGDAEQVQIWADYGHTFWWEGRASRSAARIVDGIDPHGTSAMMGDPDAEAPRQVNDGAPDWVPATWRF